MLNRFKDTLVNLVANLGTAKDKRSQTTWASRVLSAGQLTTMYREDWLAGKIIDVPVDDMTRKWRTFSSAELSSEQIEELKKSEKTLLVQFAFNEALKWARLYGGSAIVLGLDGAGEMDEPLDVEMISQGALKYLLILDSQDINPGAVNTTDPSLENFRRPEYYSITSGSNRIHYSRVLAFEGLPLPWRERAQCSYWGQSILQRVYDAVINASSAAESVNSLMYESKIDVVGVKNLAHKLSTPGEETSLINRFIVGDQVKSLNNMLLIDLENEEHTQKELGFGGLSDLILRFLNIAAAAADIPATRLLGESAPGLNATGAEQTRNYYDMVSGQQEARMGRQLDHFDEVWTRSVLGFMPKDWASSFDPLWQLSEVERATVELQRSQRDKGYLETGTLTSSMIAKQLKTDETYMIPDEYLEALEEIEKGELEGELESAEEAPREAAPPPPPGMPIPVAPEEIEAPIEEPEKV